MSCLIIFVDSEARVRAGSFVCHTIVSQLDVVNLFPLSAFILIQKAHLRCLYKEIVTHICCINMIDMKPKAVKMCNYNILVRVKPGAKSFLFN